MEKLSGFFGQFGGAYVSKELSQELEKIEKRSRRRDHKRIFALKAIIKK